MTDTMEPQTKELVEYQADAPLGSQHTFKHLLHIWERPIAEVLPAHVTAQRIAKCALMAINRQPKLLECTQASIMQAVMTAAELGLDPSGGTLGQGYLVPYRFKVKIDGRDHWVMQAQFIPGYKGLCDLARRGGDVRKIEAHVVYSGDQFEYELGTNPRIRHVPAEGERNDKDITHAYAIAWLGEDDFQFEVMTRQQIDKIRGRSKAGNFGPWVDDFAQMARKTPIRRLANYLPISSERLSRALELADREEVDVVDGTTVEPSVMQPTLPKNAGDALADALGAEQPAAEVKPVDPAPPAEQPAEPAAETPAEQQAAPTFETRLTEALHERGMANSKSLNALFAELRGDAAKQEKTFDPEHVHPKTADAIIRKILAGKYDHLKESEPS